MTEEVFVDDPGLESAPHSSEDETEEVNRLTKSEEPEGEEPEEPKDDEPETESEEPEDADDDGEDTAAKPKKKNTAQERIAELTRLRREAERERDAYRQMAQELAQGRKQDEPKTQEPLKSPRRYDYSSDEEYDAAMATYTEQRAAQIARQEVQQYQQQQQQTEAQRKQQETLQQVTKAEQQFAAETEDYFETISTESPLNDDAVRQTLPAESVPKVLYHLHKHPEEAQRIAELPTTEQAVYEIGRLESSLSQPRQNTTKAPNPPKTVKGQGKSSRKWRDDMPMSEVEKRLGYKQ